MALTFFSLLPTGRPGMVTPNKELTKPNALILAECFPILSRAAAHKGIFLKKLKLLKQKEVVNACRRPNTDLCAFLLKFNVLKLIPLKLLNVL